MAINIPQPIKDAAQAATPPNPQDLLDAILATQTKTE